MGKSFAAKILPQAKFTIQAKRSAEDWDVADQKRDTPICPSTKEVPVGPKIGSMQGSVHDAILLQKDRSRIVSSSHGSMAQLVLRPASDGRRQLGGPANPTPTPFSSFTWLIPPQTVVVGSDELELTLHGPVPGAH